MSKILIFDFPHLGYDLVCSDRWMWAGETSPALEIRMQNRPFGEHTFIAGKTRVTQIGDERGSAVWECLQLCEGLSLLYLGVAQAHEGGEMLLFEERQGNEAKAFPRQPWTGLIELGGKGYRNLFVAFHYLSESELHIVTRGHAARVFAPTLVYA